MNITTDIGRGDQNHEPILRIWREINSRENEQQASDADQSEDSSDHSNVN